MREGGGLQPRALQQNYITAGCLQMPKSRPLSITHPTCPFVPVTLFRQLLVLELGQQAQIKQNSDM